MIGYWAVQLPYEKLTRLQRAWAGDNIADQAAKCIKRLRDVRAPEHSPAPNSPHPWGIRSIRHVLAHHEVKLVRGTTLSLCNTESPGKIGFAATVDAGELILWFREVHVEFLRICLEVKPIGKTRIG